MRKQKGASAPAPEVSPEQLRESRANLKQKMLAGIEDQGTQALRRVSITLADGHRELERLFRDDVNVAKRFQNVQAALRKIEHEIAMNMELTASRISDMVEILKLKDD